MLKTVALARNAANMTIEWSWQMIDRNYFKYY